MPAPGARRSAEPDIAAVAALLGDPVRASVLLALLDGCELSASELAVRANTSAQAASAHLAKLVAGGLLAAQRVGRQRLFRIGSPEVAHAVESLAGIARPRPIVALDQGTAFRRLREARSCYDHLAGRLGVLVTDRLVARRSIVLDGDDFVLTRRGEALFGELGIDVERARAARRRFARACIDWTERRPHLGGSIGAAALECFLSADWVRRNAHDRALRITSLGRGEFERRLGLRLPVQ